MTERETYVFRAMQALFEFAAAVQDGDLTTRDLADEMEKAIGGGHCMLEINLAMAARAIRLVKANPMTNEQRRRPWGGR